MRAEAATTRGARAIRAWWSPRRHVLLGSAIVLAATLGTLKVADELARLVLRDGATAAIDLGLRYEEVHQWFAGRLIYETLPQMAYPPHAYAVLWPFMGWMSFDAARWIWAVTSLAALCGGSWLLVRASGAESSRDRLFVALLLPSMNAAGVTIGNGQLALHLLPLLVLAPSLVARADSTWRHDAIAACCLTLASIKPTTALPFAIASIAIAGRPRLVVLAAAMTLALSLAAASFQEAPILELLRRWVQGSRDGLASGYGDLHSAVVALGVPRLALPATLVATAAHAAWAWRHRDADPWLQIGVAAVVARMFAYHRVYDDVLVVLAMLALYRVAIRTTRTPVDVATWSGVLLGVAFVAMLAPARLELAAVPWRWLFIGGHAVVWLAMLAFLAAVAASDRRGTRQIAGGE